MRRILTPAFRAHKITDITPEFLRSQGVRAAILDLDGNLVGYQGQEASSEVAGWIARLLAEGIRLCIVSNPGTKSTLAQIAFQLKLKAFKGSVPKPLPRAFLEARRYLGVGLSETAMIGDQLLTDMLGGNLLGMVSIWVTTVPGAREGWVTRNINRRIERSYRARVLGSKTASAPYITTP